MGKTNILCTVPTPPALLTRPLTTVINNYPNAVTFISLNHLHYRHLSQFYRHYLNETITTTICQHFVTTSIKPAANTDIDTTTDLTYASKAEMDFLYSQI